MNQALSKTEQRALEDPLAKTIAQQGRSMCCDQAVDGYSLLGLPVSWKCKECGKPTQVELKPNPDPRLWK